MGATRSIVYAGVFASSSTWAFVVGIGGAAAVASGYKFTVAAGLLSVLVVTHGIGSYAAKLGGHKRHRDALMFVGAQGPLGPRRAAPSGSHGPGRSIRRRQVRERQLRLKVSP